MMIACLAAMTQPFVVPVAIWTNGKQVPLKLRAVSNERIEASTLNTKLTFTFHAVGAEQTVSIAPPRDVKVVFQLNSTAESCRFQNDRSVFFLGSKLHDFPLANAVWCGDLFVLPSQAMWESSRTFRAQFSKSHPMIKFTRVVNRETSRLGYLGAYGGLLDQFYASLQDFKPASVPVDFADTPQRSKLIETLARLLMGTELKEGMWREGLPSVFCVKSKNLTLVYVFNYSSRRQFHTVQFSSLGLSQDRSYTVFDQDLARVINSAAGSIGVGLEPESVRALMIRTTDSPDLIGSAQNPLFLFNHRASTTWNANQTVLKGAVEMRQGETETVYVRTAVNGQMFERAEVVVDGRKVEPIAAKGFIGIEMHGSAKGRVEWSVKFASKRAAAPPKPEKFTLNFDASGAAVISRVSPDDAVSACMVFRNDEFVGIMGDLAFWDFETVPGAAYSYRITPISFAGVPGSSVSFVIDAPRAVDLDLADLKPLSERPLGAGYVRNRSGALDGAPILLQGAPMRGMGVMCGSEIRWKLNRSYDRLKGAAAVEERYKGEARFEILLDGRSIWKSGVLKAGEKQPFEISVSDGLELTLRTQGPLGPVAWLSPRLLAKPHP